MDATVLLKTLGHPSFVFTTLLHKKVRKQNRPQPVPLLNLIHVVERLKRKSKHINFAYEIMKSLGTGLEERHDD